jgi:glycosyltransferase involved in cell wall biosynthesis
VSARRPRVLIVKPIVPYPPDQGTKVVSFDLIRALRDVADVTVLARVLDNADIDSARRLEEFCERVVTVAPANRRSFLHRVAYKALYTFLSLVTRRSLKSLYDCPGSVVLAARELAREGFDLVVVEYWQLYPLFDVFPRERTVLLTHDIDMLVNRQSALLERRLLHKTLKVRRWLAEQREEVRAYRRARRVLALTERDAQAVRTLSRGMATVDILPFGLDSSHFRAPESPRREREVLFMGTLAAPFNRDSLEYFARSILPLLDDLGDFCLTIVGGELPSQLAYLADDPRVSVVGRVADVRPFLHRAACIVIPLRFGGGLRIRTLEAMMAGLPVVCSSVAMAGMDFEPGRDFLQADTPAEFATELNRVMNTPGLGDAIAASALGRVVAGYDAAGQAERTRALFEALIQQ